MRRYIFTIFTLAVISLIAPQQFEKGFKAFQQLGLWAAETIVENHRANTLDE